MATEYGFHSISDNRDYAFASGTTYKEVLSYLSDLTNQYVVQREPVEWTRAEAPLPTTTGSVIEANVDGRISKVLLSKDIDNTWALLDGNGDWIEDDRLTNITVLFEAP